MASPWWREKRHPRGDIPAAISSTCATRPAAIASSSRWSISRWRASRNCSSVGPPTRRETSVAGRAEAYDSRPAAVSSSGVESPFRAHTYPV